MIERITIELSNKKELIVAEVIGGKLVFYPENIPPPLVVDEVNPFAKKKKEKKKSG